MDKLQQIVEQLKKKNEAGFSHYRKHGFVVGPPEKPDEILTAKEAAKVLKLSDRSIYRLCEAGRLEAFRVSGPNSSLRITKQSLDAFIKVRIREFQEEAGLYTDPDK